MDAIDEGAALLLASALCQSENSEAAKDVLENQLAAADANGSAGARDGPEGGSGALRASAASPASTSGVGAELGFAGVDAGAASLPEMDGGAAVSIFWE